MTLDRKRKNLAKLYTREFARLRTEISSEARYLAIEISSPDIQEIIPIGENCGYRARVICNTPVQR